PWLTVTCRCRAGFRNGVGACYVTRAVIHSIVPLAVLEAVRNLDTPVEDGLSEFAEELLSKRLGLSHTVAIQLAQYATMVGRGGLGCVRHRLRRAAAPAGRLRRRDAPHRVPRHGRRPLRVARRAT